MKVEQVLLFDWDNDKVYFKNLKVLKETAIKDYMNLKKYFKNNSDIYTYGLKSFIIYAGLSENSDYIETVCKTEKKSTISTCKTNGFTFVNADLLLQESVEFNDLKESFQLEGSLDIEILFNYLNFILKDFNLNKKNRDFITLSRVLFSQFWNRFSTYQRSRFTKKQKTIVPDFEFYNVLKRKNLAGYLEIPETTQILHNIGSYDLRSAYLGMFIRKHFPVDTFFKTTPNYDLDAFWIADLETDIEYPILQNLHYEEEKENRYSITNVDFQTISMLYPDFKSHIIKTHSFYTTKTKTGRLDSQFLLEIINLYNKKEEAKKNNQISLATYYKHILHCIYGKIAQRINCENESDYEKKMWNRVFGRYACPQFAIWANSYTFNEVVRLKIELGEDFIAGDTDSIKGKNNDKLKTIIEEANNRAFEEIELARKEILRDCQKLKATYIDKVPETNIGTWKDEGIFDNYISFDNKKYCYSIGNKITCKFNGCGRNAWKNFIKDNYNENVNDFFEDCLIEGFNIPEEYCPKVIRLFSKNSFSVNKEKYIIRETLLQFLIEQQKKIFFNRK